MERSGLKLHLRNYTQKISDIPENGKDFKMQRSCFPASRRGFPLQAPGNSHGGIKNRLPELTREIPYFIPSGKKKEQQTGNQATTRFSFSTPTLFNSRITG